MPLTLTTAGESHGPRLTAILEGIPAGLVLDPAFVEIESNMVMDKATAVKGADFDTSQLELSEWKSAKLDNDAALVTYLVTPKDPKMSQERHTTIWANRGGKWVALLHIGTPVMKPMTPSEMKKM